jgi:hypothetical protein
MKPEPRTGKSLALTTVVTLIASAESQGGHVTPRPVARPGAIGKADAVTLVHAVEVPRLPVSRLEPVIGAPRYAELARAADQVRQLLAGRTIWNVNSTAAGGGVAEMLGHEWGPEQGPRRHPVHRRRAAPGRTAPAGIAW